MLGGMAHPIWLRVILALWLLSFAASFVITAHTAPSDFGLTAGLNRIETFLGWQLAAAFLGVLAWLAGNRQTRGSVLRRLSRVPLALFALFVAGLVAVILWARFMQPSPDFWPPGPVTAPAAPADQAAPVVNEPALSPSQ